MDMIILLWLSVVTVTTDQHSDDENPFQQHVSDYNLSPEELCSTFNLHENWDSIKEGLLNSFNQLESSCSVESVVNKKKVRMMERKEQYLKLLEKVSNSPTSIEILNTQLISGMVELKIEIDQKYETIHTSVGFMGEKLNDSNILFGKISTYENKLVQTSQKISTLKRIIVKTINKYDETYTNCVMYKAGQLVNFQGITQNNLKQLLGTFRNELNMLIESLDNYCLEKLELPKVFAEISKLHNDYNGLIIAYKSKGRQAKAAQLHIFSQNFEKINFSFLYDEFVRTHTEIGEASKRITDLVNNYNLTLEAFITTSKQYITMKTKSEDVISQLEVSIRNDILQNYGNELTNIDKLIEEYSIESFNAKSLQKFITNNVESINKIAAEMKLYGDSLSSLKHHLSVFDNSIRKIENMWLEQEFSLDEIELETTIISSFKIINKNLQSTNFHDELRKMINDLSNFKLHMPTFESSVLQAISRHTETTEVINQVTISIENYVENGLIKETIVIYMNKLFDLLDDSEHWEMDQTLSTSGDTNVTMSHIKFLESFMAFKTVFVEFHMEMLKQTVSNKYKYLNVPSIYIEAENEMKTYFSSVAGQIEENTQTAYETKSYITLIDDRMNMLLSLLINDNFLEALSINDPLFVDDIPIIIKQSPIINYQFKYPTINQIILVCQKLSLLTQQTMVKLLSMEGIFNQLKIKLSTEETKNWFYGRVEHTNSLFNKFETILGKLINHEKELEGSFDMIQSRTQNDHMALSDSHQKFMNQIRVNNLAVESKWNQLAGIVQLIQQFKDIQPKIIATSDLHIDQQLLNRLIEYFSTMQTQLDYNRKLMSDLNEEYVTISDRINSKKEKLKQQLDQIQSLLNELKIGSNNEEEEIFPDHSAYFQKYKNLQTTYGLFFENCEKGEFDFNLFSKKYQLSTTQVSNDTLTQIEIGITEFLSHKSQIEATLDEYAKVLVQTPVNDHVSKTTPNPENHTVQQLDITTNQDQSSDKILIKIDDGSNNDDIGSAKNSYDQKCIFLIIAIVTGVLIVLLVVMSIGYKFKSNKPKSVLKGYV